MTLDLIVDITQDVTVDMMTTQSLIVDISQHHAEDDMGPISSYSSGSCSRANDKIGLFGDSCQAVILEQSVTLSLVSDIPQAVASELI